MPHFTCVSDRLQTFLLYLTKQKFPHTSGIDSKIRKVSLLEKLFRVETVTDKSHATLKQTDKKSGDDFIKFLIEIH